MAVNGKAVREKLLSDGDAIAFSHRCKIRFGLPNAASNTAVLDLNSVSTARMDMQGALLLGREIILGPGPGAHVCIRRALSDVILCIQGGRMHYRGGQEVKVDGALLARDSNLPMDKPIRIGTLSFVLHKEE